MNQKSSKFPFLAVIAIFAFLVMALGVIAVIIFLRSPLAEPIAIRMNNTPIPTVVSPAENQPAAGTLATATAEPMVEPTVVPTVELADKPAVEPAGMCGSNGSIKILFIGTDRSDGVWPHGADSIRMVDVNFDKPAITVISFPRDLWVKTPELASQNIQATRLGLAFYHKNNATSGNDKSRVSAGASLVGQTLYDNFEIAPQAYIAIHMENVTAMVDAIGGVDINNPSAFISDHKVSFQAGMQHMSGDIAREYLRTLEPGGEAARQQRQNLFLQAVQSKVLSTDLITKLPDLLAQYDEAVVTDLTPQVISSLVCMVGTVSQGQIGFHTVSGNLVSERSAQDGLTVFDPNVDQIKAKLTEWMTE